MPKKIAVTMTDYDSGERGFYTMVAPKDMRQIATRCGVYPPYTGASILPIYRKLIL